MGQPAVNSQRIKELLWDHYGVGAVEINELHAYLGRNYSILDDRQNRTVLKISAPSEQEDYLEFENQLMNFISSDSEKPICPRVFEDKKTQKTVIKIKDDQGMECFARLISYLPGKLLSKTSPHSGELLQSLGRFMADLDKKLMKFSDPIPVRNLKWDLKNALRIKEKSKTLLSGPELEMVSSFIDLFETISSPHLPILRQSLIHNDGNDYNLFTETARDGRLSLAGIIDFGDTVKSYLIGELAICLSYTMMGKPDPLTCAAEVISSYHAVLPLEEIEIEVLFSMICLRLCVSVVHSAEAKKTEPDNEYLQISEKPAWDLLKTLHEKNPRYVHFLFRHACGLPADPNSRKITEWLKANHPFAPVLERDLIREDTIKVLDFSIKSPEIKNPSQFSNISLYSKELSDHLERAGKQTGIGRYDEPRLFYTSEQFKIPHRNENRTYHIGMDLFAPAKTPVYLPLDGKVQALHRIDSPLDYGHLIIMKHQTSYGPFYTLYGHLSASSLENIKPDQNLKAGDKLGEIGALHENGGWPPHLHFQIITDLLNEKNNFPGVAPPSLRKFYKSICPDPNLILQIPEHLFPSDSYSEEDIADLRHKHLCQAQSLHYRKPLHIVRGYMQHLYDQHGNMYLDTVNNVCHVGHSNPHVAEKISRQAFVLNTNSRYYHQNRVQLAEKLVERLPSPLSVCFFVNSGSEANELAFRLAKTHTGSEEFVVVDHGYHGNTNLLIDISPYKFLGKGGGGQKSNVHRVDMPWPYRWDSNLSSKSCGEYHADQVKEAVDKINNLNKKPAAFICESVIGVGGQIILPPEYLQKAYGHIRSSGGVCIADEVQIGMGRVGSHFWGFELSEVIPDIVTIGKPIGNGHPLAAVITTPEIALSFTNGMEYFNTFGGNPVSCAAGLAVFEYMEQHDLQKNAADTGQYLKNALKDLQSKHPLIGDVRGAGLFLGIELVLDLKTKNPATARANYIYERMKEEGIFSSTEGPYDNVLKIKPPIIFSKSDADRFCGTLGQILLEDFCQV